MYTNVQEFFIAYDVFQNQCEYTFNIGTVYACENAAELTASNDDNDDDDDISGGSIFLIMLVYIVMFYILKCFCFLHRLFVGFFMYCTMGYIWNVYKNSNNNNDYDWKNYRENIPHITFWNMIPKWTYVCYINVTS